MTRPYSVAAAAAVASILALFASPASAQNVVLNPATIQGTLELTGQTVTNASVSASWTDTSTNPPTTYSASTSVSGNSYTLIVNVPQGTTPTYTVYAYGYISGSNQSFSFPSQTVNPDPASPQTLNFSVNPGVIQGTVTASGGTLNYFYIYAGSSYSYFPGSPGTYSLIVNPGTQIYVYGYGYGQFGGGSLAPSYQYVDVNAGQIVSGVDWTINIPSAPPQGAIAGTVTLTGSIAPTYVNVTASGASYASVAATPSFSMPDLYAGSYSMYGYAQFPNNTYLSFPYSMFSPSNYVTVSGGATTTVDISGSENVLNGVITLGGTNTLADVSSASFNAYGIYGTESYGGGAGATLPASGAFSLVLTDGSWAASSLSLNFNQTSDPANYLYEQLYFFDYDQYYNPIALSGAQTVTKNLAYAMGKITINFKALAGATFSYPQLYASCSQVDPVTMQAKSTYSAYSYNYSVSNVTESGVTFAGMAGVCQVQASAYVNGNNYVTFGNLTVVVEAGVIKEIDLNGPSLVVTSPAADAELSVPTVTVTGLADDDVVDIESITVNGISATFVSTNNASRPHEVSFSATVPLNPGANTLTTVVTAMDTDEPGKQASDTRTVVYNINTEDTYTVCNVNVAKGARQSGSTIPIKLQVCDSSGANISSSSIAVHATGIELVSGSTNGLLQDSGNANPGMNFRLTGPPAMYMFNLQTTGFAAGTYRLLFTIGSDPTVQGVSFEIR
jgi:hypothetical protein